MTGGSQGVGRAIVQLLLAEGASVTALARREQPLRDLADSCRGGRLFTVQADVTDERQMSDQVQAAIGHFGRLDGVVANAGAGAPGRPLSSPNALWREQLDIKVLSVLNTIRPAVDALTRTAGRVVVINGVTARAPETGMAAVSAGRAAVLNLARSLAVELAPDNIRVNTVNLGAILTERQRSRHRADGSATAFEDWCRQEVDRRGILVGRMGQPAEVAPVVALLLSGLSAYITGTSIDVAGGSGGYL
ncbi:SDR family NAD(P)-dependent oxidoreductase [Cryptosporangium arvum]|uniref:SDR family NAD(P)-dependent oxidoreductase n=1 Tax=Cryptosporangium arvum TaxID=80871 RepID=UPI00247FCD4F|nr:SDR family oxidoreductase [Cryptosporangium arvum]